MKIASFALPLCLLAAPAFGAGEKQAAIAHLKGVDGATHGTVTLTQLDGVVLLHADLINVPEGGHGFHIHETGKCKPDFGAAGDHFNPEGVGHGFAGKGPHAGDMANVFADGNGRVIADVLNPRISLKLDTKNSLFDEDGSAIVLHAKADTYGEDAGAGDRIACGVITK